MLTAIPYNDKGTSFSATDFTGPSYQLWMKKNGVKQEETSKSVFGPAFVGSLIHKNSEETNEINVIKEFSTYRTIDGHTIGGTIDRIEVDKDSGTVTVADIKTGGHFPMLQKYRKESVPAWHYQLSIYRWLLQDIFDNITTDGKIYIFVLGHQRNKDGMPMEWTSHEELMSFQETEAYLRMKLAGIQGDKPPSEDCEKWRCDPKYCDYYNFCKGYGVEAKAFS